MNSPNKREFSNESTNKKNKESFTSQRKRINSPKDINKK